MLLIATGISTEPERAKLQIDAIKYGLGLFAAGGAVAALMLGVRRQQLSEHAHRLEVRKQDHIEADAADRRVTEIYTKAAEQLGSSDAAVRLAGLYSLERLAQNHADQQQTIVNVICAYLRMPYRMPKAGSRDEPATGSGVITELPARIESSATFTGRDPQQELQVRRAAQRILIAHLCTPFPDEMHVNAATRVTPKDLWKNIDIDLSGATLVDWYLRGAQVRHANFDEAQFYGRASFLYTRFSGQATFENALFMNSSSFASVQFECKKTYGISFYGTRFLHDASFHEATFSGAAYFNNSKAMDGISFSRVKFLEPAFFSYVDFTGSGDFSRSSFLDGARFDESIFRGRVSFNEAALRGEVSFRKSHFSETISFHEATLDSDPAFDQCEIDVKDDQNRRGWPQSLINHLAKE
ncbi:hypothetical protein Acsp02_02210 [Actinoplanes sp. NBRC 103695]|nr:hypothetical protein Acsp02_02210 [Actinoplanes sp. NBRC 103695]